MDNKKILAIIPARGGSKRVPGKNVKLLINKPLIVYTIEAALGSKYLDRIIVSTDDEKIAIVSRKYNIEIVKRPRHLATGKAKTVDAVFHILEDLEKKNYIPENIILLQPTSPLRTTQDIDNSIELFSKNKCESVISVCEIDQFPYWAFIKKRKYLDPILGWKYFQYRRQDLPKAYMPNGAIYISSVKDIERNKGFYSSKILPYIMSQKTSIDIDESIDFKLAEFLLRKHYV